LHSTPSWATLTVPADAIKQHRDGPGMVGNVPLPQHDRKIIDSLGGAR
jgi:hypothetical protein